MKKILTLAIALLIAAGAFAQTPARDRLDEIENMTVPDVVRKIKHRHEGFNTFDYTMLAHLNVGLHSMRGEGFKSSLGPSWQIQFNIMQARSAPTSWLALEAGWDLSWDRFVTHPSYWLLKETQEGPTYGQVVLRTPGPMIPDPVGYKNTYRLFSFTFPILAHFRLGPVGLRAGVELGAPMGGRIAQHAKDKDSVTDVLIKGVDHGKFFYAWMARVDFEGLGVYCKYCPQAFIPGLGFNYWCWGLSLSID